MKKNGISGKCRFCQSPLEHSFVDLGMSPLCQDHIKPDELNRMEPFYPLHAFVCSNCFLVQLDEFVAPSEIFNELLSSLQPEKFCFGPDGWCETRIVLSVEKAII